MAILVL